MKKTGITFHELRALLLELGFDELAPQKDRVQFQHPVIGTLLLFRPHRAKEIVRDRDMLVPHRGN